MTPDPTQEIGEIEEMMREASVELVMLGESFTNHSHAACTDFGFAGLVAIAVAVFYGSIIAAIVAGWCSFKLVQRVRIHQVLETALQVIRPHAEGRA